VYDCDFVNLICHYEPLLWSDIWPSVWQSYLLTFYDSKRDKPMTVGRWVALKSNSYGSWSSVQHSFIKQDSQLWRVVGVACFLPHTPCGINCPLNWSRKLHGRRITTLRSLRGLHGKVFCCSSACLYSSFPKHECCRLAAAVGIVLAHACDCALIGFMGVASAPPNELTPLSQIG